jgi:hypothetical protein
MALNMGQGGKKTEQYKVGMRHGVRIEQQKGFSNEYSQPKATGFTTNLTDSLYWSAKISNFLSRIERVRVGSIRVPFTSIREPLEPRIHPE